MIDFKLPRLRSLRRGNRLFLHRLLEHLQSQLRRVEWYLVPGAKDPQEAEIVLGLERSAGDAIDRVAG